MVQPYFIGPKDETGQIFSAVRENIVAIIPCFLPKQFLSSCSMF